MARISQNSSARRPASVPGGITRSSPGARVKSPSPSVAKGSVAPRQGGKPPTGSHTTSISGANIPTPIEKGHKRA